jgi:hypothetical protein
VMRKPAFIDPAELEAATDFNELQRQIQEQLAGLTPGQGVRVQKSQPTRITSEDVQRALELSQTFGMTPEAVDTAIRSKYEPLRAQQEALRESLDEVGPMYDLRYAQPLVSALGGKNLNVPGPDDTRLKEIQELATQMGQMESDKLKTQQEIFKSAASTLPRGQETMLLDMRLARPPSAGAGLGLGGLKMRNPTQGELKALTDAESAIKSLKDLRPAIEKNKDLFGKITGKTYEIGSGREPGVMGQIFAAGRSLIDPNDVRAQQLNARVLRIRQTIGSAMEGGVLRKEDEIKYENMMPKLSDNPDVANRKIDELTIELENERRKYLENLRRGNVNIAGFEPQTRLPQQPNPPVEPSVTNKAPGKVYEAQPSKPKKKSLEMFK